MVSGLDNIESMCRKMKRLPYLYITGCDPVLHSRFWDLLHLVHSKGISFTIMGNPFHLDSEVCRRLKNLGCKKCQLSIDGIKATHDFFRKPGCFDATIAAIPLVRNAGMHCTIMTTVSVANIADIPKIIDIVVENNVDIFAFERYCPTAQGKATKKNWHIEPSDYKQLLKKCWEKFTLYKDSDTTFNLKDHLWTLFLYEKGLFKIADGSTVMSALLMRICSACSTAKKQTAIVSTKNLKNVRNANFCVFVAAVRQGLSATRAIFTPPTLNVGRVFFEDIKTNIKNYCCPIKKTHDFHIAFTKYCRGYFS